MTDDIYIYPGTTTLRNKLGIIDPDELDAFERRMFAARAAEGVPNGNFDLAHLQAIHRHLFQDVYDWAGELRMVEISKGGRQFMFRQYIQNGMADIHRRIAAANCFRGFSAHAFARVAGEIMGDVNYVHPFREGNGRAQLFTSSNCPRLQGIYSICATSTRARGSRLRVALMKPTMFLWAKPSARRWNAARRNGATTTCPAIRRTSDLPNERGRATSCPSFDNPSRSWDISPARSLDLARG